MNLDLGVAPGFMLGEFYLTSANVQNILQAYKRIANMNNQGESFEFPANADDFDDAACEAAFEGLNNLDDVSCSRGSVDAFGGATFDIGEHNRPHQAQQGNYLGSDCSINGWLMNLGKRNRCHSSTANAWVVKHIWYDIFERDPHVV